ncbi:hypothetical protein M426DRAFT_266051 [Hypoxylon sp. CI-4A]|nr:hypothetical protein M426DRAFT_266051 [Hypoxylon sp. CI-4A]
MDLFGLGGDGKTQAAWKYFHDAKHRLESPFETAFWVDASSESALQIAMSRIWGIIRPRSNITECDTTPSHETTLAQVMDTLGNWTRPYLVVFDNVYSEIVLKYVPRTGPAAIILTTRLTGTESVLDTSIRVCGLPSDMATSLLLCFLDLNPREHNKDIPKAKAIVERLGCLPLAIRAAASYIKTQNLTGGLSEFLMEYEKSKIALLRNPSKSWGYAEENQNVLTTWESSLQALWADEEDRARKTHFLSICSFLSPHRISHVHFEQHYRSRNSMKCAWCPKHNGWMNFFSDSKGGFDRT